ncbi:MAG: hypothetical protein WCE73_20705 [Candidatus Angelobacter sp.]
MANGTSVTMGNHAETLVFGQVTRAYGNRIVASADVNKAFPYNVPE